MIPIECIGFTDSEVEEICKKWNKDSYPEYEGGNVIVYADDTSYFFVDVLRETCPQYNISDKAIAVYDYGNVIFEDKDTACLVIDWGDRDTDSVFR